MNKYEIMKAIRADMEKKFVRVPLNIIEDKSMDKRRVSLFCYLAANVGMGSTIILSIPQLYSYYHRKWDLNVYKKDRWQKNYIKLIMDKFRRIGFVDYNGSDELVCGKIPTEIKFYNNYIFDCNDNYFTNNQFAKIYLDELDKIMVDSKYSFTKIKEGGAQETISVDTSEMLLVFAWLRNRIPMNREELAFGDKKAEAFTCYHKDISEAVGIKEGKIVNILIGLKKIGLIYCKYGTSKVIKDDNDDKKFFNWDRCIITNAYKRVGSETVDCGQRYADEQIKMKKQEIADYLLNCK